MSPYEELEKQLWSAADELRANSHLNSSQYSAPVLGLIFLRYADYKFSVATKQIEKKKSARRSVGKIDYQAQGVLYLPQKSRYSYLIGLPEKADIGKEINEAMKLIEKENDNLR